MADVTCRCGGKGWRWTGSERVPCSCAAATRPPVDPVRVDNVVIVPVEAWPTVRDRLLRRR